MDNYDAHIAAHDGGCAGLNGASMDIPVSPVEEHSTSRLRGVA